MKNSHSNTEDNFPSLKRILKRMVRNIGKEQNEKSIIARLFQHLEWGSSWYVFTIRGSDYTQH